MKLSLRLLLLLVPLMAPAAGLEEKIRSLISSTPSARRAFWGIQIADAGSGAVLFQQNQDSFFMPASNTKLFSTALALARLGPDHRFHTRVVADQAPDADGRVQGDLRLAGGGDPTLSARAIPYQKGPIKGDPLAAIEELAGQAVARGVGVVGGDIVGDDTAYLWEPAPQGWSQDDAVWEYGAPVSALTLNDNAFSITLRAAPTPGEPAKLFLNPPLEFYSIDNRTRAARGAKVEVRIERRPGDRQVLVTGTFPPGWEGETQWLAVDDPALYAAMAFREALIRRGVRVSGGAVARHRRGNETWGDEQTGVELVRRTSPPLVEMLRVIDKVSQNLHAELMLREVARVRRNQPGSREGGLKELEQFLAEAGVEKGEYHFEDGSGLSRLTLVTPATAIKLLRYMYLANHRDAWISLMPVGGGDGTLSTRFAGSPNGRRVHAKTGTLSHASALAGYIEKLEGGHLVFSIMVNNYNAPSSEVRSVIDKICLAAIE